MVQEYIRSLSKRGTPISIIVAKYAAKALIQQHSDVVGNVDIDNSSWAKRLFQRLGYVKRMRTSCKVEIPDGVRKEIEYLFLHEIVSVVEEHSIPHSLIINLDQTPSKYVPVGNTTLAKKNSSSVVLAGTDD